MCAAVSNRLETFPRGWKCVSSPTETRYTVSSNWKGQALNRKRIERAAHLSNSFLVGLYSFLLVAISFCTLNRSYIWFKLSFFTDSECPTHADHKCRNWLYFMNRSSKMLPNPARLVWQHTLYQFLANFLKTREPIHVLFSRFMAAAGVHENNKERRFRSSTA